LNLQDGLYERLIEAAEEAELDETNSKVEPVADLDQKKRLASQALQLAVKNLVKSTESSEELDTLILRLSKSLGLDFARDSSGDLRKLLWVSRDPQLNAARLDNQRPITPISEQALFTNSKDEPRLDLELERELSTADRVEILVSFIKISGLRLLEVQLLKLRDRGIPVRLITTTYMGATDKKAIDRLVNELGVEVRIDLLPVSNRLHAKAWLFQRDSGFSTAYIGSSNMSYSALITGSEWNVRLAEAKAPELFRKFKASFETYWEAEDYKHYSTKEYGESLEEALSRQSRQNVVDSFLLPNLEVTPRPHQVKMLEELDVERNIRGHSRNLVVAATGTGKTVLAALDYKRLIQPGKPRPTLLFVAHRQEILKQAVATFRQVLGDGDFGELLVDGIKPKDWRFVFASIQSLKGSAFSGLSREHFDHLIVDEFHHAEAPSYKYLFDFLNPKQVVGLTATPERTDGVDLIWQAEFGGRIAAELRLWDAMGQDLLAPFHYFGVGEDIDFSQVPWIAGRYESRALSNLVTSNTFRNRRVLRELDKKVPDLTRMKALIFCVSVEHANQVAKEFSEAGVQTKAVTGTTVNRGAIIQELRSGLLQAIATVDVFNEGVDIPEVDTIVLLRPTESPVLFLQQIGRGLRRMVGKNQVLILDFIGAHRAEYRIDTKFAALSGKPRSEVIKHLEEGFPYLPSGSAIQLDELSKEYILDLMRRQIAPKWSKLVDEVRSIGTHNLGEYLKLSGRELFDIYRSAGKTWTSALIEARLETQDISEVDQALLRKIPRILHIDDEQRLLGFKKLLSREAPKWSAMSVWEQRLASMLFWNLFDDGRRPWDGVEWVSIDEAFDSLRSSGIFISELSNLFEVLRSKIRIVTKTFELTCGPHPFLTHATYSRAELLGGFGYARLPGNSIYENLPRRTAKGSVTGVCYIPEANLDLFFVNLQKGETISESTRYHDYSVSPSIFHWDSQNATSVESETGVRYVTQKDSGRDVLIGFREKAAGENGTVNFKLMGAVDYLKHEGSKPISIWWRLRVPLDPDAFEISAAAKVS
jgi:superfamily II DNA or RNA helicase